jgi:hypothetical protein
VARVRDFDTTAPVTSVANTSNVREGRISTPAPTTSATTGMGGAGADKAGGSTGAQGATGAGTTGTTGSGIDFNQLNTNLTQQLQTQTSTLSDLLTKQTNALAAQNQTIIAQQQKQQQQQQTNWINAGKDLLTQYDLSALGTKYIDFITTKGMDQSTAMLELQTTDEWKTRFSANETRLKQGLPVLSPADYLNTEASYKDVMIRAGLPNSVVNDTSYLGSLIAKDVSPVEVQQRVDAARAAITTEDPYVKQQLQQQFGLTTGDMVLHLLDPNAASSIIAQKVQAAQIGGEAERYGAGVTTQYAQQLAAAGVTEAQAAAGFRSIADQQRGMQALAGRYGGITSYGVTGAAGAIGGALQTATFGVPSDAKTAAEQEAMLKKLQQQEVSAFSGSSGVAKGSLMGSTEGLQ